MANAESNITVTDTKARPDIQVVTAENFQEYVNAELGELQAIAAPAVPAPGEPDIDPDAPKESEDGQPTAATETKTDGEPAPTTETKAEPKEGDIDGSKVYFEGKWVHKHDFKYRVHVKAQEKVAEAAEKATKAADDAKAAKAQRDAAERTAAELKAKYEPPVPDEVGPEPHPGQFSDVEEYGKALKDWTADNTRREDAKAAQAAKRDADQKQVVDNFMKRQTDFKTAQPDYEEVLGASEVKVSDQMREAIVDSDVGPQILYHLAKNPEVAEKLGKMTVSGMLREVGKLEAKLSGGAASPTAKSEPKAATVAEISKAPAPISPLKGGGGVPSVKLDAEGNFYGSYEEYKAMRKSGKIK